MAGFEASRWSDKWFFGPGFTFPGNEFIGQQGDQRSNGGGGGDGDEPMRGGGDENTNQKCQQSQSGEVFRQGVQIEFHDPDARRMQRAADG